MTLLDLLIVSPVARAVEEPEVVHAVASPVASTGQPPQPRRRWHQKPKRRTQADRIAAKNKLDEELRQMQHEREVRWAADELARQAQPNPPGVEPVRQDHRDGD